MKIIINSLKNISIAYKVSAISFIAVFGLFAFLVFQFVSSSEVNTLMVEVETIDKPSLNLLDQNFIAFYRARNNFAEAITGMDLEYLDLANQDIKKIYQGLDQIKAIQPSGLKEVDQLRMKFKRYVDSGTVLTEGLDEGVLGYVEMNALTIQFDEAEEAYQKAHQEFRALLEKNFNDKLQISGQYRSKSTREGVLFGLIISAFLIFVTFIFVRMIRVALNNAIKVADKIAEGDRNVEVEIKSEDETGQLLRAIDKMREGLRLKEIVETALNKEQTDIAGLNDTLRGEHDLTQLAQRVVNYLTPIFNAQVSALYLVEDDKLKLTSSYAFSKAKDAGAYIEFGEGLVGQAALERKQIIINNVPDDYIAVSSALGKAPPRCVVVSPILNDGVLEGIIEIGSVATFTDKQLEFLDTISASIAIAINSTASRTKLSEILNVTQEQANALRDSEAKMREQQEELKASNQELEAQTKSLEASEFRLQTQQEELRVTNEELEEQTKALKQSEASLQVQQEELRISNDGLEEQAKALELQKSNLELNNNKLEQSRKDLEEKSADLQRSSQYKSEFLSTMSHELRTPLNSILILSRILAENKKENLDNKQIEHAEVINSAGSDLLELINDILDLSKIEEGKLDFVVDKISLSDWTAKLNKNFSHVVADKDLDFSIELDPELPEYMLSDEHRIDQIVKNMISNTLKFTEMGGITIELSHPSESQLKHLDLKLEESISFSVVDTGIGIPKEKQDLIFAAFQQADGTTSRKFGGTGLGLTISRQLSNFLGGELSVTSDGEGLGSTFSLVIPILAPQSITQDHEHLLDDSPVDLDGVRKELSQVIGQVSEAAVLLSGTLLIIEDDDTFANTLSDMAQESGLKTIRCEDGESALELLKEKVPSAIILDVGLPGMDGWAVMDKLKENEQTKDIPVHFISGQDSEEKAIDLGAMEFLMKPVSADRLFDTFSKIEDEVAVGLKKLLVIEDNEAELLSIEEMFSDKDLVMTMVTTGEEAIQELANTSFDCMIMDLDLPDINGLTLLETLNESDDFDPIPVIVYTAKDLSREEEAQLRRYASRIILKAGGSSERLLSEVSLFLHWLENSGTESHRPLPSAGENNELFKDKKILVVDDDMRNIYSLSAILEGVGLDCVLASNGVECLESLEENPKVDAILMDIMMPEMDGYEAMGKVREQAQFKDLPILALTAKAMKEDRQKCIDAGANDYLTKPLDTDKLLALLHHWLKQTSKTTST